MINFNKQNLPFFKPKKNTKNRLKGLLALVLMVMGMGVSWGQTTSSSFNANATLTSAGNYSTGALPSNTVAVSITSSTTALAFASASITMGSLSVTNGLSYTLQNSSTGSTNRSLILGNPTSFTNPNSTIANDIIYLTGNSTFNFIGTNNTTGTAVNNITLTSSGNFNIASGSSLIIGSGSAGVISGSFNINKTGAGSATFSAVNTYTGTNTISAGTLIVGAAAPSGSAGALGNASSTITLGDANTASNNSSPSLLTGGAFIVARTVTIANQATSGTYTVGGNTANSSTFSGAISTNQPLTISQVSSGTLNITGGITAGNAGSKNLTFNNAGSVNVSTIAITLGSGDIAVIQSGAGTTTFSAVNTYTGNTTISAGTLALSTAGSIATSPNIIIGSSGTLDVSGLTTALALGASQTLKASATGSNTTGTIKVISGKGLTLGSTGGLVFTAYGGGATSPLTVTGASAGALTLNSAPITVTTSTALAVGTYKLIAKASSATGVSGTIGTLTMAGSGLASNTAGTLTISSGELILTVSSTASSSSNIILNAGFTHPTNIDYASYQSASGLTSGNSIEVGKFDIQDGGGSSDADALATTLTACSLTVANSANIRALALFDGSTNVGEITTVGATAVFSSLTLAAADDGSKTFSVRATFKSTVTDNQQISFTVASATASGSGSSFAAANAGAAATTTTVDNNKIEVTADRLAFVNQPATTSASVGMTNVTVSANDVNGNRDLDFTSSVRITSTGTLTGTPVDVAASSGLATFVSLIHTDSGAGLTLNAKRTSTTDWDVTSNTFDITAAAPEINVKQSATSLVSGSGTYAAVNIVSGNSGLATTFTIENIGIANLTYSSITNSNTTDFTLDLTSTSSPIAASSNTTFTVTFNPTTAGAKSTTITINNNDADEGTYTFTVTGTGTVSSSSDIISNSGYTYSINIDYASKQTASTLTTGNSIGVAGLIIQDGAGAADADNLGTTLTAISFTTGGSTAIKTAALFDGSSNVSEVAVNGATTISFSSLTLSATDASTKNFELRVTYQATVTDNQQITFTVSSVTASSTSSGFASANAGAAASTTTGDINRLEVTASALAFVIQPANTSLGSAMTNVTVSANDGNGNRDLDFTSSVRITSTGTLTGTPVDISASSGLATFTSLTHTAAGTGLTLNAERTSGLDWDVSSSSFNITIQAPGLLLLEDNFTATSVALTSNGWTQISTTNTNPISTGSSNGLSYATYGSSNIGNAAIMATSGQDVYRTFTSQNPGAGTSTAYFSALVSLSAVQATGDYFLTLGESSTFGTGATYRARVYAKQGSATSKILFGISTNGTITYTTTEYNTNTTILLAVKHVFTTTTSTSSLFINPSSSSEPTSADISDATASTVATGLDAVVFRQGTAANAPTLVIDGIRIATNWGSLMGNPQYNSSTYIAAGNYNNINVLSGTLTATGNVSINGTTTNDGEIEIGANTLTINGAVSGSGTITGGTSSNLTIGGAAGTIQFTSGSTNNYLKNLTLNASSSMTIGSNALNITGGAAFGTVIVGTSATLTTGGNLTLKSDASGTACIGNSAGNISGNVTVERYIPATRRAYRFLASPVTTSNIYDNWQESGTNAANKGIQITGIAGPSPGGIDNTSGLDITQNGNYSMFTCSASTWNAITNTKSTALTPGVGYRVMVRGDRLYDLFAAPATTSTVIKATGTLAQGDVTIATLPIGYNLVGNPYASEIDWDATGWSSIRNSANISNALYIYKPGVASSVTANASQYATYNGGSTTNGGVRYIASGQSFFVQVTSGTPNLDFKEIYKTNTAVAGFFKTSTQQNHLRIEYIHNSEHVDEMVLRFKPDATLTFDNNYDANSLNSEVFGICSIKDTNRLAIQTRPDFKEKDIVTLSLRADQTGEFQLKFTDIETFDPSISIALNDKFLHKIINLTNNAAYNFQITADPASKGENRFEIQFTKSTTGINNLNNTATKQFSLFPNPASSAIYLAANFQDASSNTYTIYNQLGMDMQNGNFETLQNTTHAINIEALSAGIYFIKITNDKGTQVIRFVK